jgi:hypothetical protein
MIAAHSRFSHSLGCDQDAIAKDRTVPKTEHAKRSSNNDRRLARPEDRHSLPRSPYLSFTYPLQEGLTSIMITLNELFMGAFTNSDHFLACTPQ